MGATSIAFPPPIFAGIASVLWFHVSRRLLEGTPRGYLYMTLVKTKSI
jgi:hypothetical protein